MKIFSWRKVALVGAVFLGGQLLVACGGTTPDSSSLKNESFLAASSGKADSVFNIQPGSPEAEGVLELANTASLETLDSSAQVGLDVRAAENIVEARKNGEIEALQQLDTISWVSRRAFRKLYDYAENNGYFGTSDDETDESDEGDAEESFAATLGTDSTRIVELETTSTGRVFVSGWTHEHLAGAVHPDITEKRIFVGMLEPSGEVAWVNILNSTQSRHVSMEVDSSGVYVVYEPRNHSLSNMLVAKYDNQGEQLWTNPFVTSREAEKNWLVLGPDVVVAVANTENAYDTEDQITVTGAYSRKGGHLQWNHYEPRHSADNDLEDVVATDGHVVFNRDYGKTLQLEAYQTLLDRNGDRVWRKFISDPHHGYGISRLTTDTDGEIFQLQSKSGMDIRKYTAEGGLQWTYELDSSIERLFGFAVKADTVYVVGRTDRIRSRPNTDNETNLVVYRFEDQLASPELKGTTTFSVADGSIGDFAIDNGRIYVSWYDGKKRTLKSFGIE